ncbi:MAG: hypothetical protein QOH04_826 [Sphingomonadales bacterium]|jgi:hypothetical protein|nr:hypothetical protein [Sphingomonadales bacterium]
MWWGVAAVVLVFGGIFAESAHRDVVWGNVFKGRDELLLAIAMYTLPLTLGFGLIALLAVGLIGSGKGNPYAFCTGGFIIFWICGKFASFSGLGIPPDQRGFSMEGGAYRMFLSAFQAYLTNYGWPLTVCAFAIGVAGGVHVAWAATRLSESE